MKFDWDETDEKYGNQYKDYAEDGNYDVKLVDVTVEEKGTKGSLCVSFIAEETNDYQFPTIQHWVSYNNPNWTGHHYREILRYFGVSDEDAKKVIELAFKGDNKENHAKGLATALKKAITKKKTVPIIVFSEQGNNGNWYARADFKASSITMYNPKDKGSRAVEKAKEITGGEEADVNIADLPF